MIMRPTHRARRRFRPACLAAAAALLSAVASPGVSLAGTFAVLTYNVRGLPPPLIEDRHTQISEIAPLLEDFHTPAPPYVGMPSIVGLQEVFAQDYYDTLTSPQTITYSYITQKDTGGTAGLGDGLDMLSDFQINPFSRTQWSACFGTLGNDGSDCDTDKGYSYAKIFLEPTVSVDVYTLHADAGQDSGSQAARRSNVDQLVAAINATSPAGAPVIVLGDTNSLYTRVGNDNIQDLVTGAGLTDVWVLLERGGIVPGAGSDINADCATSPGTGNCELFDKIFYRDGTLLKFAPESYAALKTMFSDGMGNDLSDHVPVAVTLDYAVVTTTTTTTTSTSSTSSTSTTTIAGRPCGDPLALVVTLSRHHSARRIAKLQAKATSSPRAATRALRASATADSGDSRAVVASDALFVLKTAVGTLVCPLCTCDVDNSGKITASDALRVLKAAVGQNVPLTCPLC
ncbi:MAG TPA: endonuclease/exonuclease/phosphatase family protein [Candidatus Binatia bacterium]